MKKILIFLLKFLFKPWHYFKKLSIKRKISLIILCIVGISILSNIIGSFTKPLPYTLEKVKKTNIVETVSENGNLTPGGISSIYSPTKGVITKMYVANGSIVKKGDVLLEIQSSATEEEQQTAKANYLASVAQLNASESTANTLRASMYNSWKSFTDLSTNSTYENGGKPNVENRKAAEFQEAQDTWLASEKKYKDQQTVISQAKAAVNSTLIAYKATQDAVVKSTMDGKITNLSVTTNSPVNPNSPTSPQIPLLIIATDSTFEVSVPIGETDIIKVEPGQKVKLEADAITNKYYDGKVVRVDSIGTKIQGVTTYNTYIRITNPDKNLRTGMGIDATITTKELRNVLSVPNSAVKPYQGGKAVRVPGKKKGEIDYIPVLTGIKSNERTQILKGLSDGQTIIVSLSNEKIKRSGLF